MKIHHEGTASILLVFGLAVVIILVTFYFSRCVVMTMGVSMLALALWFVILFFFRVPERNLTLGDNLVVSPANGTIVEIKEIFEDEYIKKKCVQVSIFMSPLNVHLNKYPISGKIVYSKYHPGKYLVAWAPKSSEINERHCITIDHNGKQIFVKQIAGFLARRIVNYAKVGQLVHQNEELGFIKFGSRVDLYLPTESNIKVKLGDKTIEGVSVIASLE